MISPNPEGLPRVFVLGSSMTIQFGPYLEAEMQGKFVYDRKRDANGERAEDNLDIPQGASGGDSSMVLAYLRSRRRNNPIPAEVLLLSCGLHDIKTNPATGERQVEPELFEQNLRSTIEEVRAMKVALAWLRITPVVDEIHNSRSKSFHRFAADVARYNEIADRVMKECGAWIIDLHALCRPLVPGALIDHIHYNEDARQLQAEFITRELERWWLANKNP